VVVAARPQRPRLPADRTHRARRGDDPRGAPAAATFALLLYLRSVGDAAPLADATTTALSLAATWMQARKQLENWLVWLAADAIYIPLYLVKGLPLTGVLYCVFVLMCGKGWRDWSNSHAAAKGRRRSHAVTGELRPLQSGRQHRRDAAGGHEVKRVLLLGAESTGKTTLAHALADHYDTVWNPELGHMYTWFREEGPGWDTWRPGEFTLIAKLQDWYEQFLAGYANGVLFCDTSPWTTGLFQEVYSGSRSPEVEAVAGRSYDLTIVCDIATPFRQDELGMREDGPHRQRMHAAYLTHLEETGDPYLVVTGSHAERMGAATAAVDALLTEPRQRRARVPAWLTTSAAASRS
jgi:nicotinamide riboside kinase